MLYLDFSCLIRVLEDLAQVTIAHDMRSVLPCEEVTPQLLCNLDRLCWVKQAKRSECSSCIGMWREWACFSWISWLVWGFFVLFCLSLLQADDHLSWQCKHSPGLASTAKAATKQKSI